MITPEAVCPRPDLAGALAGWRALLGDAGVATGDLSWYEASTGAGQRAIAAVLKPRSRSDVAPIMLIAAQHGVALWPISTGRNWGYGTAQPVREGSVVVDLSGLAEIRSFDAELGLVTLEPGVTQGRLAQFLAAGGHPFMVPTTGAGPHCSVLANALERGFGLAPACDHFAAVTAIEAVLPDGSGYRSPLSEIGAHRSAGTYKWGFGPYLDGLFAQGSFGIVTAVTLALARQPAATRMLLFQLRHGRALPGLVERVRGVVQDFPGVVTTVKLTDRRLALATTQADPSGGIGTGGAVDDAVGRFAQRHRLGRWLGIVALHGEEAVVRAALRGVRSRLRQEAERFVLVSPARITLARGLLRSLGPLAPASLREKLDILTGTLGLMQGRPDDFALRLAYWRNPAAPAGPSRDPARDGCGLLWYAPIVPIRGSDVAAYVAMVERVMAAHGFTPLVTLTSVSASAFDSTVPVLFDPARPGETERAHACHRALLDEGLAIGVAPYRHGIQAMDWLESSSPDFIGLVGRLKQAVDPSGILSPGRYAPLGSAG